MIRELYSGIVSCALFASVDGMVRVAGDFLGSSFHHSHQKPVAAWQVGRCSCVPSIGAAHDVFW